MTCQELFVSIVWLHPTTNLGELTEDHATDPNTSKSEFRCPGTQQSLPHSALESSTVPGAQWTQDMFAEQLEGLMDGLKDKWLNPLGPNTSKQAPRSGQDLGPDVPSLATLECGTHNPAMVPHSGHRSLERGTSEGGSPIAQRTPKEPPAHSWREPRVGEASRRLWRPKGLGHVGRDPQKGGAETGTCTRTEWL